VYFAYVLLTYAIILGLFMLHVNVCHCPRPFSNRGARVKLGVKLAFAGVIYCIGVFGCGDTRNRRRTSLARK
jgi:hypothetical protein